MVRTRGLDLLQSRAADHTNAVFYVFLFGGIACGGRIVISGKALNAGGEGIPKENLFHLPEGRRAPRCTVPRLPPQLSSRNCREYSLVIGRADPPCTLYFWRGNFSPWWSDRQAGQALHTFLYQMHWICRLLFLLYVLDLVGVGIALMWKVAISPFRHLRGSGK